MNHNTVVSQKAAADLSAVYNVALKLTSTGVNTAAPGDRVIGTLLRGAAAGAAADLQLVRGTGLHLVPVGNATELVMGDELELAANGRYVKRTVRTLATSASADDILDCVGHGFVVGQEVRFLTLTGGSGLFVGVPYYVIAGNFGADTFQVSTVPGGTAVNFATDVSAATIAPPVAGQAWEALAGGAAGGQFRALLF